MDNRKNNSRNRSKCIRLSYTLTSDSPIHPALKKVIITGQNQILGGDDYNTSIIKVENHSGTHVDAPAHFLKDGRPISDYDPDELAFSSPMVLDCHKHPDELLTVEDVSGLMDKCCDCLLIRTGFGKYHDIDTETYVSKNPGISPEAINCLRGNLPNLACLGIDTVSMSRYGRKEEAIEVHQNAFNMVEGFGKPLLLVEDLDLKPLEGKLELENVLIIPWQVGGIDSAPCTVLATVNQSTK